MSSLYQHILVASDLSPHSHKTVDKAHTLANTLQAKLSLIHIVEPINVVGYGAFAGVADVEREILKKAQQEIAKVGAEIKVGSADQYVEMGIIKHTLLNKAKELKVDLIVIGSQGRSNLSTLLGSTAAAVANHAHCDVIIVH